MSDGLYKIGEVASVLGTSVRTIRYYEEESLISPIRTGKGTRLYSASHLQRLKAILHLTRNGFALETIGNIASIREQCATGSESSRRLSRLFDETLAGLERQIQALAALKQEMQSARETILTCRDCQRPPSTQGCPDCLVRQRRDEIPLLNLVWDEGIAPTS